MQDPSSFLVVQDGVQDDSWRILILGNRVNWSILAKLCDVISLHRLNWFDSG